MFWRYRWCTVFINVILTQNLFLISTYFQQNFHTIIILIAYKYTTVFPVSKLYFCGSWSLCWSGNFNIKISSYFMYSNKHHFRLSYNMKYFVKVLHSIRFHFLTIMFLPSIFGFFLLISASFLFFFFKFSYTSNFL